MVRVSYEGDGAKLRNLSWSRDNPIGTIPTRSSRYSRKRLWSLFFAFLAAPLAFIFARIMNIEILISVRAADPPPSGIS